MDILEKCVCVAAHARIRELEKQAETEQARIKDLEKQVENEQARIKELEKQVAGVLTELQVECDKLSPAGSAVILKEVQAKLISEADAAASMEPANQEPFKVWQHPTKGEQQVDSVARWKNSEFASNLEALRARECAPDEVLACHYTSNASAHLIFSQKSHGLRASTVGQLDGGVSVCKAMPHMMGWEPYGRGGFRYEVGEALWGEKRRDVLLGQKDADKINLLIIVKVRKAFFDDPKRQVPGRDKIVILPRREPELLAKDGFHWLPKDQIVKVYRLMGDNVALDTAMANKMNSLSILFSMDVADLAKATRLCCGDGDNGGQFDGKLTSEGVADMLFVLEHGGLSNLNEVYALYKTNFRGRTITFDIPVSALRDDQLKKVDFEPGSGPAWLAELAVGLIPYGKSLTEVILRSCAITSMPQSIRECKMLEVLILLNCKSLESLPESIGDCKALRELSLQSCYRLTSLPMRLKECKALNQLTLYNMWGLRSMPDLSRIKKLKVDLGTCGPLHLEAYVKKGCKAGIYDPDDYDSNM
mmetsp:Transcript_49303/g.81844  ORF Transcript_49303/g.81844 Transcript_49303/m.81844 type:complete len:533 (+) Transcript_49303:111-1709(+)